jgi:hypothetical protein
LPTSTHDKKERKILVLVEDVAQRYFLESCKNIISKINKKCICNFVLDPIMNCEGKDNMVHTALPSALAVSQKRLLLTLDLDYKTDHDLTRWVENSLDNAHTKDGVSIKIIDCHDNCITVKINKVEKIVVIIPLGLPNELPKKIQTYSVEDYILADLLFKGKFFKRGKVLDSSKKTINELKERKSINEQQSRRSSINRNEKIISRYIEPLWKF